jgi:O-6-methylguanine DNA methyltransferase
VNKEPISTKIRWAFIFVTQAILSCQFEHRQLGAVKRKTDFFKRVYSVVEKIPYGKVTTYGRIAERLGMRVSAQFVGWALHSAPEGLPCHRVVNRFGALSGRQAFGDPRLMKELLVSEGVTFVEDDCVDLEKHLWEIHRCKRDPRSGRNRKRRGK